VIDRHQLPTAIPVRGKCLFQPGLDEVDEQPHFRWESRALKVENIKRRIKARPCRFEVIEDAYQPAGNEIGRHEPERLDRDSQAAQGGFI